MFNTNSYISGFNFITSSDGKVLICDLEGTTVTIPKEPTTIKPPTLMDMLNNYKDKL